MVKINLLTPELGGPKRSSFSRAALRALSLLLFTAFLLITASSGFIFFQTNIRKRGLISMMRQYQETENIASQIKVLRDKKSDLSQERDFLSVYDIKELRWSQRLFELSRIIPAEVWLTQLNFNSVQASSGADTLFIKGGLYSDESGNPLKSLSGFIKRIQDNKLFAGSFNTPVLSDLHSEMKNDFRIMAFSIELPYKDR